MTLVRNGVDDRTLEEGRGRADSPLPAELSEREGQFMIPWRDHGKLDLELLEKIAAHVNGPGGGSLAFVGPIRVSSGQPLERVQRCARPNVLFTGQKRHRVPAYLRAFDVCLIPYMAGTKHGRSIP